MTSVVGLIKDNYKSAVRMLEAVQKSSVDMVHEIGAASRERSHFVVNGYSRLTKLVAIGAPDNARIAVQPVSSVVPAGELNGSGVGASGALAFSVEPTEWMTLEGFLALPRDATLCSVEIDLRAVPPRELVVDTFLRVSDAEGAPATDTAHRMLQLGQPGAMVATHDIDETISNAASVRFIVSVREPKGRFELHRCIVIAV